MDPATLCIKFTPLIKYLNKKSVKCRLEIIPELSSIQNFDKIHWQKENDLIEYIVPITYKIIIKKKLQHDSNVIRDTSNKIYHSCVDLLISSPVTNMNLATSYVQRIISDTCILNKVLEDRDITIPEEHNSIIIAKGQHLSTNDLEKVNDFHSITSKNFDTLKQRETTEENLRSKDMLITSIYSQKDSTDNTESTKNHFNICHKKVPRPVETRNKSTSSVVHAPVYSICQVNVRPVCVINTEEKIKPVKENVQTKSFFEDLKNINSNLIPIKTYRIDKKILFKESFTHKILSDKVKYTKYKKSLQQFDVNNRKLPEVRVTEFIKFMTKEFMPLKHMLQEILHKCSTLGITCTKVKDQRFESKICINEFNGQETQCEKYQTSNRFVYTIVFNE